MERPRAHYCGTVILLMKTGSPPIPIGPPVGLAAATMLAFWVDSNGPPLELGTEPLSQPTWLATASISSISAIIVRRREPPTAAVHRLSSINAADNAPRP